MQKEFWKSVKGYEGYYEVSNLGRVRSVTRKIERTNPKKTDEKMEFTYRGKLVKFWLTKKGYCRVTLNRDNIKRNHLVHRLVCDAFIENTDNKPQVNHKNGIKTDNTYSNLEWCTNEENFIHSVINGMQPRVKEIEKYL